MGHSSMDPAFHELRTWNEGRLLGAKRALKPQQVWAIRFWLDQHRSPTRRLVTCVLSRSFLGMRRSIEQFATSALASKMRSNSRSAQKSDRADKTQ